MLPVQHNTKENNDQKETYKLEYYVYKWNELG